MFICRLFNEDRGYLERIW